MVRGCNRRALYVQSRIPGGALHELEDLRKPGAVQRSAPQCPAQQPLRLQLQWIRVVVYQEIPSDKDHYTSRRTALHGQGYLNLWHESDQQKKAARTAGDEASTIIRRGLTVALYNLVLHLRPPRIHSQPTAVRSHDEAHHPHIPPPPDSRALSCSVYIKGPKNMGGLLEGQADNLLADCICASAPQVAAVDLERQLNMQNDGSSRGGTLELLAFERQHRLLGIQGVQAGPASFHSQGHGTAVSWISWHIADSSTGCFRYRLQQNTRFLTG